MKKKVKLILLIIGIAIAVLALIGGIYILYLKSHPNKVPCDIVLKGDKSIKINTFDKYKEPGYKAHLYKRDVTKDVKVTNNINNKVPGTYAVTYLYNYNFLNVTRKKQREIIVEDKAPPTLSVDSSDNVLITNSNYFPSPKATATDNVDGDLTSKIKVESNVNTKKDGTYKIVYTVSDSSGNEARKEITVTVKHPAPKPAPKPTPKVNTGNKNAYITVSIANQKMYYYEYGKVALESNIVTGIHNGTPRGTYAIRSKARNATLKGKDYTSYVRYWMAFIGSSYGFHDASWRSSFGGQIYKTNGSHGCINMPTYKAAQLYNMVSVGTPVYIS